MATYANTPQAKETVDTLAAFLTKEGQFDWLTTEVVKGGRFDYIVTIRLTNALGSSASMEFIVDSEGTVAQMFLDSNLSAASRDLFTLRSKVKANFNHNL